LHPHPDLLKSLAEVSTPDPRSHGRVRIDATGVRPLTLEDHHAAVAGLSLSAAVPEHIQIAYDTARNLYIYAWYVYRFYPLVEHQALACLEMGLRQRLGKLPPKYWRFPDREPTLKPLLRYAIDQGLLRNEGFRRWREQVQQRAKDRHSLEMIRRMSEEGLKEMTIDPDAAVPNDGDRAWDYLLVLLDTLPAIRNDYAHGSTTLHSQVLGMLELVGEVLDQIFEGSRPSA